MSYYGESPLERITDVHWKKKKDPPPDDGHPPPYCGRYGYGGKMDFLNPGLITSLPYGPNQFPPFVGTFRTDSNIGSDGTDYGAIGTPMLDPPPTLTAGYGLHAASLGLNSTSLDFTNNQLIGIPTGYGSTGVSWTVPMVGGYEGRVPRVIKSYTLTFEWAGAYGGEDEFGIGISHPKLGTYTAKAPPEPFMSGLQSGGAISFTYDFKWLEWAKNEIIVNDSNQFDPTLGGPAMLWAMARRKTGATFQPWGSRGYFASAQIGLGDWYTWEIVAACQPMPNIF